MLIVSPSMLSAITELRIESGMDRNTRIIIAVRQAAITASRTTPLTAAFTKTDWSASNWIRSAGGRVGITRGRRLRIPCTTSTVDAAPVLRTVTRVPRCPSWRTTFVWGEKPSRTCATSPI